MVGASTLLLMCFVVAMAVAAPLSDLVLLQMRAESTASRSLDENAKVQRNASTLPSLDVDVTNEAEDQQKTEMAELKLEMADVTERLKLEKELAEQNSRNASALFNSMDTNKDGVIDRGEASNAGIDGRDFDIMDKNGDGGIDKTEAFGDAGTEDSEGAASATGSSEKADTNNDGVLDKDEAYDEQDFERRDKNGDEVIDTKEELLSAVAEETMKDLELQKRIEDKHVAMRWIAKSEAKHKEKQEIVKLEKDLAKQKDLVNEQIEDKHKAKQFIVKLEKELAEQKSEDKDDDDDDDDKL